MRISHRLRHLTIWLACFAMLFNGIVPSMASTVVPTKVKAGFIEICSAEGNKLFEIATGKFTKTSPDADSQQSKHGKVHCANCLPHADHHFLLPTNDSDAPNAGLSEAFPPLFYHSPQTLFSWASAQPRAPPALS
ncbi:DUF2946 domain-containing protein [Undibacterium sp. SXout7W]|uniref:DUF2946 domain-containing protein n=1 Tax=Undibacterium sp. SXout7W TaxID=3413049 RepID=UPI003BF173A1